MGITTLVLGGGGSKGISIVGTLSYFHSLDKLQEIKRISGTSIGSVIGSLIGIKMSPESIFKISANVDTPLKGNVNYSLVFRKYGVWSLSKSLYPFTSRLIEYFGKSPTFKEYYELTGVHLKVCTSNLNKLECVYFDHITHPDILVIDALRASCCIPGVFKAVKIKGDFYVDGGFVKNFPLDAWEDIPDEEILGIVVSGTTTRMEIKNGWEYIGRLTSLAIIPHIHSALKTRVNALIIKSVLEDVPLLPTSLSEETKEFIYKRGILDGKTYSSKKVVELDF